MTDERAALLLALAAEFAEYDGLAIKSAVTLEAEYLAELEANTVSREPAMPRERLEGDENLN